MTLEPMFEGANRTSEIQVVIVHFVSDDFLIIIW